MVPHLTTALTGPLLDLERRILERMPEIERWLRTQWQEHAVPFYGCAPNRFYAYGVIARLAQLAAAIELEDLERATPAETVAA